MKTKITPRWRRCAFTLVAAASALSLTTGSARAQEGTATHRLELDDPSTYARAADVLVSQALLLPAMDPGKSAKLREAGRLYDAANLPAKARTTTLDAGVAAYRAEQHAIAAHIFLDTADPSLNRGVRDGVRQATERAAWVLRNGRLTESERTSILERARGLEGVNVESLEFEDMNSGL